MLTFEEMKGQKVRLTNWDKGTYFVPIRISHANRYLHGRIWFKDGHSRIDLFIRQQIWELCEEPHSIPKYEIRACNCKLNMLIYKGCQCPDRRTYDYG